MYFNRKNTEQKNWRMIKKGKHFLFGCSLVLAIGGTFVAPSVKADTVEPQPESSTTNEEEKPTSKEESSTYVAPAVTVASTTVTETNTAPATDEKTKEESEATVEKTKESDAIQAPSLTMVADPATLTEEEKANVVEAVKGVNPTATDVQVQADGSVVVTFADGSSATLTPSQTIKVAPKAEISATEPKSRNRRAVGQERSMEGSDIKYVYQNKTAQVNSGDPTQRADIEYRQLDDYEVVNGKTVSTDPSGQGRPVLEWTVTFNKAQYDKPGGYYYFTIPKNVSNPYDFVTNYNGSYSDRSGWKDANKESNAGVTNKEGVQYIDAGSKLEWRVKNTVGNDYKNVNGLSGVMGDTKQVHVLHIDNSTSARKITIKYRTVVEDSSQAISYLAGVESKTGLPRNNWYAISGKYDKHLVSQVVAPEVTPNLTNTSVNVPVQTVASTSSTLSGTGTPGAKIKLYIDGREQNIGNVTVDNNGNWTTGELPTALNNNQGDGTTIKPRQTVQVSQTVNGTESSRRTVPVSVGVTTVEPSSLSSNQDAVVAGQKEVTLKVPHDAGIAYLRYTDTAGQTVEIPVKRDNLSAAWVSQKSDKATVKSYENGKFQDTIVLTMVDKIAGTEVAAISNVTEGGFSSVAGWQPRPVEKQAPTPDEPATPQPETPKPVAPAGQAPEITSNLDGKASTPADVIVNATAGSTVKLYNKDGVVIGEAVANDQGVATVHPTNSLPEGEITATTTPAGGSESAKSAPITVTKTPTPYTPPGETNAPYYQLGVGTNTTQVSVYRGDNLTLLGGGASSSLRWFGVTPETVGNVKGLKYTETLRTRKNGQGELKGTVAWDQPLGETKVVFGATGSENATSNKQVTIYRPITVTVLETTKKYDPVTGTKVDIADSNNLSGDDKNKIIDSVKAANPNLPAESQYSVDEKGNLTITYPDGSTDKIAAAYLVNPIKDTTAPDKPVVNTDLTGKAGTKTPVEVTAEKGSTVALYDKDNNKIGEATAGENGKATITPTVDIPAGAVTAKATDAAGNTSVASDPATATPAADTTAPDKPVVNTDLTGKAGTKTPVEVTAEKGSTVALYDKDNNKIGEATAGENGKATITPTVDIPAGAVTAKATDAAGNTSVASDPATATATVVAPTVEIPYSNKDTKEVYVYAGEENSFDIKFKDDSGKIVSATVKQGGNREFSPVAGEADTINTQYGFKANVITTETPATADAPAVITYRGTPAATDGLSQDRLDAATKGENPEGMVLGWRYATATDADGALIENKAVGSSTATDPGAFRVVLKAQSQKYDIATPTEKVTVADPANVTEDDLAKIKEKLQLEYSQTNDDANLADKKGTTADKANKIQSVTKDDNGNLVVTYTDGSQDKKPLSEFVNVAPTVELPYSNQEHKQIYVYTGENTDLTFKATDNTAVKDMYVRGPGGIGEDNTARYGFTTGKIENAAVTHGDGTVSGATATIKMTGVTTLTAPNRWTSFVVANDNDNAASTTDFNALDKNPNATQTPGYVQFIVKSQTDKYDIKEPTEKVVVADPTNVTNDELDKIKEKLQLEYNKKNDDANISKDSPVNKDGKIQSVTKDDKGNLVVTYTDGSKDTKPLSEFVTRDTEAPAKPVVNTDLTGKAGTKTPVEVSAEPGSTVALYDKDGNKIGEATAGADGKATITPTVDIPEGAVTAKATDAAGNTSEASEPAKATTGADTEAPAKPVVNTDLTGKAGTKTPVEVSAEPGSTVALYDKDGNKIGEATAGADGKATITPTVDIPEGAVTAKATDAAGNTSEASEPAKATTGADTEAPAKPVVNTDLTGKAGTKTPVEVSAEPGSTVALYDKDGNKIGEATAGADGKATITPTVDIPEGAVTAKATDAAGNTSEASEPAKATTGADTEAPAKPVVNTDLTGKAGTKTPVEVSAEPGSTVALYDKDGNKIGEATAGADGKATITPTVDIPEGAVTAKATDAAGNTSEASEPAKATTGADTEAPAKPVVNTDLTGKAGTKTPVEVSAEPGSTVALYDKDGNKIGEATAGADGKATITPTVDIPEGAVTAKATDAAGNTSEASEPAKATTGADTEAPAKPVVNTDLTGKAGTKTPVEVSAEPGSTVALYDKDGNKIGEATAGADGKATITPTVDIPEGAVTAKATDAAGNTSEASEPAKATTGADTEAPAKPVVNTDLTGKAGTKTPVEVSAEPGSTVALYDKDGNKIGEATAGADGKATITPTVDIPEGAVTAKATDAAGNTSEASEPAKATTGADTEAPAKPVVNTDLTGKAGTKTPVEVSAEPGSTVALYDKDGNKIGEATAGADGKATITPTVDIPEGAVTAKATDAAGNTSEASEPAKATTGADTEAPAKPVVNTDLTGKAGTKTPVEVSAEPGSTVALYDKDGNKIGEATAGADGKATITPTVDIPEGAVTAKATDAAGNTSEASEPAKATTGADTEAPAKPVVNTDLTGKAGTKTPVEVSAEPGSTVALYDKDGNKIGEATAGADGKATITPTVDIPEGAVTAKATDAAGNTSEASEPAKASADDKSVKDPAVTPVVDPSNLTDAEKAKVAGEVKKANPTASKVEVGNDGTATVTYPDGTSAVIPADKTVKKSDDKSVKDPAVTPVVDPSNLTDAEKAKVADEVKKANPTASKVEVGNDGTATVTYPDGTSAVIPADKTVKKSDDKSVKDPAVTPVVDPSNLTDAEKAKVADEVKKANPTASKVEVGNDGTATVAYPDGTSAVIPADKTVKKSDDKSVKDPAVTPVVDPSNLTDAEKAKVADEVKKANPTASKVEVGNDGTATVTYPDGTSAVIPADKTVKKSDDKSVKDPAVTPVVDPSNLTDAEKAKVADEVKKANPSVTDVTVGNDGTATVTYPDGTTAVIPADKTVKKSDDKAVKDPAVTPVVDPSNLTDAEKAKVADEVKKANPTASKVEVGNDGTATVTYPDGTTAVIPADKTVKKSDDKAVKDPAVTPVVDPSNLTDAEKAKVADEVKKANPSVTDVTVGNDGTATVTYPDGTSAVIPADKTVKKSDDKAVKDPAVTPVVDPSNLTDAEKAKVADEVKKANPTASKVEVGNDGTATVTYPDGTTAVIPADKTVKKSDDKAVKDPAVTPVVDPSNLTDAEKAKVADEVKKANPSVTDVTVGNDGTATVTYPDGTTAVIPADKTVKKSDDKAVKDPAVTPVVDPSNLTDAEKAKVADEVKKANPTASKVEVGNDGTATVTYPDGTTAVIPADKTVKKSDDKAVKDPAVTPVVDPSNLTDAEKAKVADEVKKANPSVTDVTVGNDGTATVTYPDGTSAVIPADKTVKKSDDKAVKDPAVTPVVDPSNLTDAEKAKVADEVKKANPTASKVEVGNDGTATVTYPDGTTAVIPADKTVKKSDDKAVKDPAVTPVVDPSNLTDAEKAKVADEVKKANPSVTDVTVGNDGTATVTYPDGTTAVIPADKTVKKSDDKAVKDPAVTPVVDPSNLTDAEKAKVADEVKKANPTASKVEVGNDGTATVTYPDGTTAVIPADKTVKKSDDKAVKDPAVTPVVDPSNLTDAEKAKVADEVKKANPSVTDVTVGNDGTATVTYPDGTSAVIPADKTVKKSDDKAVKDPAVTPVVDPSNLTDAEKAKVADEVKKANPTASKVEVGNDGTATVTYPDGTTAVIPADKTVKKSDDKAVKDPAVTPVVDPSNLTDAEKAKVADEVKKANPSVTDVTVGNDGTATVTYPDGTTAVIPADKTVKKSDDKAVKDPAVTPVVDPSNLTDAEKAKVADEVKKANPTASKVEVGNDGTATVTYPDGTSAVIPADKTVKKSDDKSVKDPAVTPVVDPSNLTDAEKAKVADEVKKANPTASKVEVGNDGTATVTYPDGTSAVIPADKTVKKSDDKSVKDPAVTPVVDPSNLTDAEKAKVAAEVKKANPTASKVEVGNDGTTTVTYPDGTSAVIPADKTVKKSDDKSVKDPAVTPVVDPSNLTDAEKAKVADEVKKANPTASKVEVGNDGTATVTYPDGTTAVIPADKTVKKSDDKSVKDPAVTSVVDPSNLTDAEKAKVADEVKKANPTASKVEVGNDGTATVTFPDGSVAVLTPAKTVRAADSNGVKNPSVTPVVNPSALTDAEKAKVADEVKKANPTATDIKVNNDGSVVVTFADGSVAVIASENAVKEATKESSAIPSAKKAGAKELPNTGTEQSNASLGLALLAAVTGGLLFAKKRKEEE